MGGIIGILATIAPFIPQLAPYTKVIEAAGPLLAALLTVLKSHADAGHPIGSIIANATAHIEAMPLPRKMTPQEEQAWFDRAQGTV